MSVSFVVVVAVFVNYLTDGYAAAFELSFVDSPVHSSLPYLDQQLPTTHYFMLLESFIA